MQLCASQSVSGENAQGRSRLGTQPQWLRSTHSHAAPRRAAAAALRDQEGKAEGGGGGDAGGEAGGAGALLRRKPLQDLVERGIGGHAIHQAEAEGRGCVDHFAGAKEPPARGGAETPPGGD